MQVDAAFQAASTLFLRADNDALYGDDGCDLLCGGLGNDLLDGGLGSDTYYFGPMGGHDTMNIFKEDQLVIYGLNSNEYGITGKIVNDVDLEINVPTYWGTIGSATITIPGWENQGDALRLTEFRVGENGLYLINSKGACYSSIFA